ncbi:MAG: hypothetical protein ACQXXG_02865 [Candidatus Bathyarchaeia archaeon]|nr:hypothetical protein [Candidatus Bathyarchaeota archaeon A05DMB-3]MDH7558582.1 hypothetical protein [Candidatus Bathyarchaeota archaeon]
MSKLEYGFVRAISEIVAGFVMSVFLSSFVNAGLIPDSFVLLFHVLNVLSTVLLVFAMPFWATSYSIGWLVGLWVMYSSGLVEVFELLVYLVPLIIVGIRFVKKFE